MAVGRKPNAITQQPRITVPTRVFFWQPETTRIFLVTRNFRCQKNQRVTSRPSYSPPLCSMKNKQQFTPAVWWWLCRGCIMSSTPTLFALTTCAVLLMLNFSTVTTCTSYVLQGNKLWPGELQPLCVVRETPKNSDTYVGVTHGIKS